MVYIAPSLLAADFSRLAEEVEKIESMGANYLHLDIMDGHFVPNISFGPAVVKSLRAGSMLIFDVHLMIEEPMKYADRFISAGADIITVHYETCDDPEAVIKYLHEKEVRVGMAISPKTPWNVLVPYLDKLDMVLVMTVEPGFGGQKMMPEALDKVTQIRRYADANGLKLDIEVDGGLNADNVSTATSAGANVIVAGSAIFGASKPKAVIAKMKEEAAKNPFLG